MNIDQVKVKITETILVAVMFAGFVGALCELLSLGDVSLQSGSNVANAADKEDASSKFPIRQSYEIEDEDGVMFFEVAEKSGNRKTYYSDRFTIKVISRSAGEFQIQFVKTGNDQETSLNFPVAKDDFYRLAEMFDVTHVRHAGGII